MLCFSTCKIGCHSHMKLGKGQATVTPVLSLTCCGQSHSLSEPQSPHLSNSLDKLWCSAPSRVSEVPGGWGRGTRWHQLWAGSSWCLRPVSHPPRCLEKKQRCVTNQRNGDKYSPCWINIPRITHVSFKVKQRSCATWQPPIWPEKSRHMDGAR